MPCDLSTIQSNACASGIGRVRDRISLLQIIAQLTCEASGGGSSPSVYRALISQASADDPTVVVLENTLGGTPIWTRSSPGAFYATLSGAFPDGKVWCNMQVAITVNGIFAGVIPVIERFSNDQVRILIPDNGIPGDDQLLNTPIEILVYP